MTGEDGKFVELSREVSADSLQDLVRQIDPMDVLNALIEGLYRKRSYNDDQLSEEDDQRLRELIDLMWYVEWAEEEPPDDKELPKADQLRLIDRQVEEGLISEKERSDLRQELLEQFQMVKNPDIPVEQQYRCAHKIVRGFNPVRKLTCG